MRMHGGIFFCVRAATAKECFRLARPQHAQAAGRYKQGSGGRAGGGASGSCSSGAHEWRARAGQAAGGVVVVVVVVVSQPHDGGVRQQQQGVAGLRKAGVSQLLA